VDLVSGSSTVNLHVLQVGAMPFQMK
jgi:hypothetical protein